MILPLFAFFLLGVARGHAQRAGAPLRQGPGAQPDQLAAQGVLERRRAGAAPGLLVGPPRPIHQQGGVHQRILVDGRGGQG